MLNQSWTMEEDGLIIHLHALRTPARQIANKVKHPLKDTVQRIELLKEKICVTPSGVGGHIISPRPGVLIHLS